MLINVVTVTSGWILQKIAERIVNVGNLTEHIFELSNVAKQNVDCNFYVDVQNTYKNKSNTIDIGMFTHLHEDSIIDIQPHYLTLDYIIHMSYRYMNKFIDSYPKEKMLVLYPAEVKDMFQQYKPLLGIFQRGQYIGKGFNFMLDLAEKDIIKKFRFKFVGSGWDQVIDKFNKNGIETYYIKNEDYIKYPEEILNIDYLLIPSLWEGGPMSVLEALASGKPIISSKVGFTEEFPIDFRFEPNNIEELISIFEKILKPIVNRRDSVVNLNFSHYVNNLIKVIEGIKIEKT